jgi:hypothetical protein
MRARATIFVLSAALVCQFMAASQDQDRDFEQQLEKIKPPAFENRPGRHPSAGESWPEIPDRAVARAYERAAARNVLAAVNPKVFFGYWSVCADGQGFGYGYTYPSLDGHQMTDALLWLGRVDVVKANWDYVRSFERPDGALPIAILPNLAGKQAGEGDHLARVDTNGGLSSHWVPGNPLEALADPTYIRNADDIFRMTLDLNWLAAQLPSVNLSADHLASLVAASGAVRGAGYYVERPARIEYDGVAHRRKNRRPCRWAAHGDEDGKRAHLCDAAGDPAGKALPVRDRPGPGEISDGKRRSS